MADLITVQEYKDAEGIRGDNNDDRLAILVPQVSELAKKYCGTSFIDFFSSNKTETFNISDNNTSVVVVSETPINSVVSVKERDNPSTDYITLTNNTEFYIDTNSDSIFRLDSDGDRKAFKRGFGSVEVVYKAGYATTPKDLQLALFDLVTYYLKDEHKQRRTLGGATIQNQGTAGIRTSTDFPDHIKRVLDLYRVII
tara:strand:- start:1409 stop:2002 length:594 start_codon:yes stop_codon:yes gene_type:complete